MKTKMISFGTIAAALFAATLAQAQFNRAPAPAPMPMPPMPMPMPQMPMSTVPPPPPPPPPPVTFAPLQPPLDNQLNALPNYDLTRFAVVIKFAPSAPDPAPHPELPMQQLPAIAQIYWAANDSNEQMRRLRAQFAELQAEADYRGLHLLSVIGSINVKDPEPDSAQEDESVELRELQRKAHALWVQIQSLRTELQMRPLPVKDETHVVEHTGNYSVITSGTAPRESYVNRNVAEEPAPKSTSTHTEVTYHIVNVIVPMGFARDGTPLTRKGMDIQRTEKEVLDH